LSAGLWIHRGDAEGAEEARELSAGSGFTAETRRAWRKRGENQRENEREKRREERRGTREVQQVEAHVGRKLVTARLLEESDG